jgi:hypothetical protein
MKTPVQIAKEILEELAAQQEEIQDDNEEYSDEDGQEDISESSESAEGDAIEQVAGLPGKASKDLLGKGAKIARPTNVSADANKASLNQPKASINEDTKKIVKGLFEGVGASEDAVEKAIELFESTINGSIKTVSEELESQYSTLLVTEVEKVKTELTEQLDKYLDHVVVEWLKENQLQVEQGLRTEIAEEFLEGLKNLFEASYISVPNDKVDVFDEMLTAVDNLEKRVNQETKKNVELSEELAKLKGTVIFNEETAKLTGVQRENLRKLTEGVKYSSDDDYRSKVKTLVESATKNGTDKKVLTESKTSKTKDTIEEEVLLTIDERLEDVKDPEQSDDREVLIQRALMLAQNSTPTTRRK